MTPSVTPELVVAAAEIVGCRAVDEPINDPDSDERTVYLNRDDLGHVTEFTMTFEVAFRQTVFFIGKMSKTPSEEELTAEEVRPRLARLERLLAALESELSDPSDLWRYFAAQGLASPAAADRLWHTSVEALRSEITRWKEDLKVLLAQDLGAGGGRYQFAKPKQFAAEMALDLFEDFGAATVKPKDHLRLAELILQAATGDEDAYLVRYCQAARRGR